MARNVEIKARLADMQIQLDLAQSLCGGPGELIHQVDVFFHCERGRLKLRLFDDGHGELIHYHRPSEMGPKLSDYVLARSDDPGSLREALSRANGVQAIVEKERRLFIDGRTRIHLDQVKNLGTFLELEVVLGEQEEASNGHREADSLMKKLQVDPESLIDRAYVDLLQEQGQS